MIPTNVVTNVNTVVGIELWATEKRLTSARIPTEARTNNAMLASMILSVISTIF